MLFPSSRLAADAPHPDKFVVLNEPITEEFAERLRAQSGAALLYYAPVPDEYLHIVAQAVSAKLLACATAGHARFSGNHTPLPIEVPLNGVSLVQKDILYELSVNTIAYTPAVTLPALYGQSVRWEQHYSTLDVVHAIADFVNTLRSVLPALRHPSCMPVGDRSSMLWLACALRAAVARYAVASTTFQILSPEWDIVESDGSPASFTLTAIFNTFGRPVCSLRLRHVGRSGSLSLSNGFNKLLEHTYTSFEHFDWTI